jgi:hypothetical protein
MYTNDLDSGRQVVDGGGLIHMLTNMMGMPYWVMRIGAHAY